MPHPHPTATIQENHNNTNHRVEIFLSYSLNYLNIIIIFFNYYLLYNYTPHDLYYYIFVDGLVSDEAAVCAPGVICFLGHYSAISTFRCSLPELAAGSLDFCV